MLTAASGIDDYLRYAMFRSPAVEAAYYEWAASVENITVARSLPDPRLTFSADVARTVASLVPGLMVDLPGPGKLAAAGNVAAAGSHARYFAFEIEVLRTAFAVKTAYYRLLFLEDSLRVHGRTLQLLGEVEQLARQQVAAGRAMLQDVLRAQIDQEQIRARIDNLEDSRTAMVAEFKAALGIGVDEPDPPVPAQFVASSEAPSGARILDIAFQRNPRLRRLAAEVRQAQAMLDLARKAGVPDISAGIEVDLKAASTIWTPSVGITLPIWRDRIAAGIAAAQAGKRAAEARLSGEQIGLAAELAATLYTYRESVRNIELIEARLLPRARQTLEIARAGYAVGNATFLDVVAGYRQLLDLELALIEARTRRELALASLSLLIAGADPHGSPTLFDIGRSRQPPSAEQPDWPVRGAP